MLGYFVSLRLFPAWSSPLRLTALIRFVLARLLLTRGIVFLLLPRLLTLISFVCH